MPKYRFTGETVLVYPDILLPEGGSLVANPGDIRDFDEPPPGPWFRAAVNDKPARPAKAGE